MGKYYFKTDISICKTTCKHLKNKTKVGSGACGECHFRLKPFGHRSTDKKGDYVNCSKTKLKLIIKKPHDIIIEARINPELSKISSKNYGEDGIGLPSDEISKLI
jgi:hypothetical protein